MDLFILSDSSGEGHSPGIAFSFDEWWSFFFEELGVSVPLPYVEGEDMVKRGLREKAVFIQALSDFPMLARIQSYNADAQYDAKEVISLLGECTSTMPRLTNPLAVAFGGGIIAGCKKAIKCNAGLLFLCD